jgi:hypothetical protein
LILRNSNDQKLEDTRSRELRDLYTRGTPEPVAAPPAIEHTARPKPVEVRAPPALAPAPVASAPPPVQTVIVLSGSQKRVETFPVEKKN